MRGVIPNNHHSQTSFFVIILILLPHVFSISTLSPSEILTISSNRTIVSPGDVFELGFFTTPPNSRNCYLGIWYKTVSVRTYVWIANRDKPLSNSIGTFKISYTNLVLLDESNNLVWSTNLTSVVTSPMVAELLDNGNFVLRDSKSNDPNHFLWQTFDFPVDTLLPEMKLGRNLKTGHDKFLTSWKSPDDPSSGDFSFKLETQGLPQFCLYKNDIIIYRAGQWDGIRFNGMPSMQKWSYTVGNFIENREEVSYSFKVTNQNIHSRLTLTSLGYLKMVTRINTVPVRNMFLVIPLEECDLYRLCGSFSYCDMKTSPVCNCIKGFLPKNVSAWELGDTSCVRMSPLSCQGDEFLVMKNMKLPDTSEVIVDKRIGFKECKEMCLKNCNCTGFANTDIRNGGSGCVIWTGELMDMRNYVDGGQDLYIRLGASSLFPTVMH